MNYVYKNRKMGSILSEELYGFLFKYITNNCKQLPDKKALIHEMSKTMHNDAKKNYNRVYKKFKNWAQRMQVKDGKLIYKFNNKIIISEQRFLAVVKKIHESQDPHLDDHQTACEIQKQYTWGAKEFGMSWIDVAKVVSECDRAGCRDDIEKICKRRRISIEIDDQNHAYFCEVNEKENNGELKEKYFVSRVQANQDTKQKSQKPVLKTNNSLMHSTFSTKDLQILCQKLLLQIYYMKNSVVLAKVYNFAKGPEVLRGSNYLFMLHKIHKFINLSYFRFN